MEQDDLAVSVDDDVSALLEGVVAPRPAVALTAEERANPGCDHARAHDPEW